MARESNDPDFAKKLITLIDALQRGEDVERAANEAGLNRDIADRFLESTKAHVLASAQARTEHVPTEGKSVGKLTAFTDGASRGNPGQAACGVIFYDEKNEELLRRSKRLGVATNNVAEYQGVILALELATSLGTKDLRVNLDSELVVKQLNHEYKVKHPSLKPLFDEAKKLMTGFEHVDIVHVSREKTKLVDKLANDELDGKT